jgi:hypothetical protein
MTPPGGPTLAVIQLDAVSLPLVERLIDEGRLPALAELRGRGRWCPLGGSTADLQGAAAATVHSGVRPGRHGVYYPFEWSAADQRMRARDGESGPEPVWARLGRAGRRSLVIDPYDAARVRAVEGVAVCGWQVTNRVTLPRWSAPGRVQGDLTRRFGKPGAADEIFGGARLGELVRLRGVLLDAPGRVVAAAGELLRDERLDLAWIELVAPHLAGHQFWAAGEVVDLGGAGVDERAELDAALADVYEAADRALGAILAALPGDCDVIVMASSGMGPETDRSDMLPGMLAAVLDGGAPRNRGRRAPGGGALWSVRASVPASVRARVASAIPDRAALAIAARLLSAGMDWSRTRAFAVPNEPSGGVRLNLRGREREGIVDPSEADELVREIEAGLLGFREPDGEPAVTAVERVSDLEPSGPRLGALPDLLVRWSPRASTGLRAAESPEFGEVRRAGTGSGRSGNHTGGGWALLVPARSRPREPSRPAELVDVAATVCAVLGIETEARDLDGEPLLE